MQGLWAPVLLDIYTWEAPAPPPPSSWENDAFLTLSSECRHSQHFTQRRKHHLSLALKYWHLIITRTQVHAKLRSWADVSAQMLMGKRWWYTIKEGQDRVQERIQEDRAVPACCTCQCTRLCTFVDMQKPHTITTRPTSPITEVSRYMAVSHSNAELYTSPSS